MCMYGKSWRRFGLFEEEGVTKVSTKLDLVGIRDFACFSRVQDVELSFKYTKIG